MNRRLRAGLVAGVTGCILSLGACGSDPAVDAGPTGAAGDAPVTTREVPGGVVVAASTGAVEWDLNVCDGDDCRGEGFGMAVTVTTAGGDEVADFVVPMPQRPEEPASTERVIGGGGDGVYWSAWSIAPGDELVVTYSDGTSERIPGGSGRYVPLVTLEADAITTVNASSADGAVSPLCETASACGHGDVSDATGVGAGS